MPDSDETKPAAPKLTLSLANKAELYRAYMPFLKRGGLFVPTEQEMRMGDSVLLLVTVLDQGERFAIEGTVAWLTPRGASNKRRAGVGVHFNEGSGNPKPKLEAFLGAALSADRPTETL